MRTIFMPVLSTCHMPHTRALKDLGAIATVAEYDQGGFVYLPELAAAPDWLKPIIEMFIDDGWVRFDADEEVWPGLPTYDWN